MRSLREVGGVHLRGEVGEVWANHALAGLVYTWRLDGWERDWRLEADRYRLDPQVLPNGERQVEVLLTIGKGELRASGTIWTDYVADDHSHRAIVIKGGALKVRRAAPA